MKPHRIQDLDTEKLGGVIVGSAMTGGAVHKPAASVPGAGFFFSFHGPLCGIWRFPDKGSNRSCSCQPTPQLTAIVDP